MDEYPWARQERESTAAYEAFRVYMNMGARRNLRAVAAELDKSPSMIGNWSSEYNWRDRTTAYDTYITTAAVDGIADQVSSVRHRHIELADKLMDHLSDRLDQYVADREDPSVRWTHAFVAAANVHTKALAMDQSGQNSQSAEQVEKLIKRVLHLP
jgi:hypothetical protein